jgi:hypothetical protein
MARRKQYPFWTQDTIAAAALAGIGTASVQSKLEAWALALNNSIVTAMVHYWPLLMIFAGLVLLLTHPVASSKLSQQGEGVTEPTEVSSVLGS